MSFFFETSPIGDAKTRALLQLREKSRKYVVSISGGGTAFFADFLSIPGGSESFLEGIVPYSPQSTADFLGFAPEKYCSEKTARLLAAAALRRASRLYSVDDGGRDATLVGVGATAALVVDRPKRGGRRVFCAVQTFSQTFSATLTLQNGARPRAQEERLAADFILSTLLFATENESTSAPFWREITEELPILTNIALFPEDVATVSRATLDAFGSSLLFNRVASQNSASTNDSVGAIRFASGKIDRVLFQNGRLKSMFDDGNDEKRATIYPGSFNPPHRGHRKIAELTEKKTGVPVAFELSVRNVDKPPLDALEILRRVDALEKIAANVPIWLSNAPRFVEKAALFPNATFALGSDSLLRLADTKYEKNSFERRDAALEQLANCGARFLVFPRKIGGRLVSDAALALPQRLRELCEFVSPEEFLDDVSSTELRAALENDAQNK